MILPCDFIRGISFNVIQGLIGNGRIQNTAFGKIIDSFAYGTFHSQPQRIFHIVLPVVRNFTVFGVMYDFIGCVSGGQVVRDNFVVIVVMFGKMFSDTAVNGIETGIN